MHFLVLLIHSRETFATVNENVLILDAGQGWREAGHRCNRRFRKLIGPNMSRQAEARSTVSAVAVKAVLMVGVVYRL